MDNSGLLLIDKEAGMSSRKVDNLVGIRFNTHKVGHLGTLDPFATGLLIVAVNKGTKYLPYLEDEEKTYEAALSLGKKTSTGDNTSDVIEVKKVPELSEEKIKEALSSFLGESEQIPPMTSAKKIDGVALYKKAHQGLEIERKPTKINVYEVKLNYYEKEAELVSFTVRVSKGTYIRTLGEDLAVRLGTIGHLTSLRRLSIGNISVHEAKNLKEANFIDPLTMFSHFEQHVVESEQAKDVKDGKSIKIISNAEKVLLLDEGKPLAIYKRKDDNLYVSERGLF